MFPVKGQKVNILDFVGPVISVATIQPYRCSMTSIDYTKECAQRNAQRNVHDSVPIKLY